MSENMNKIHYSEHQKHQLEQQNLHQSLKDEKRTHSVPFDRFLNNSKNNDNYHYGRFEGPHQHQHQQQQQQQQEQQQHHNLSNKNNSKFMSFFAREGIEMNNSSSSLNEFFKQASSSSNNNKQRNSEQPKSLSFVNQMPSVEQLEAKWRRNSLGNAANDALNPVPNNTNNNMNTNKQTDNFQKLIGALNGSKVQQQQGLQTPLPTPPQVGNDAISNFIMQQQQYQQQQQKQHMLIQQQQQQTAFLASLQLKAILGRADTQLLLLRLTKGKCNAGSFSCIQSEI